MMKYEDFYREWKGQYYKSKFTNKHGEDYIVLRTKSLPSMYFVTGDETDWDVMPLFDGKFDIWSSEEIVKLGQALANLGSKK